MKLRDKSAYGKFLAKHPDLDQLVEIEPQNYLRPHQYRKMITRPALILQFSQHIADQSQIEGFEVIEIRAEVKASLNNRPYQWLIKPQLNLLDFSHSGPI